MIFKSIREQFMISKQRKNQFINELKIRNYLLFKFMESENQTQINVNLSWSFKKIKFREEKNLEKVVFKDKDQVENFKIE